MTREQKTMDGNGAAAHVAYAYSEVAAIYPITPSSAMAEYADEWATEGRTNIFGETVKVSEMQSEAGAAGAVHGALTAGALTTTFTASQGLLLMLPNLYRIAGELLPGVFHVAARTISTHALSIFGDHSDIYACRQSGVAMWASGSVQEVMDLSPVAHLAALEGRIPFLHFFDGFRTSHELQKIHVWAYEDLKSMLNQKALESFRRRALNPNRGKIMGSAQNPDIFFQAREASNPYYEALPGIVETYLQTINQKLGTQYGLFDYYGASDAEHVIIAMGSVCETIEETVDYRNRQGDKTGLVKVHLYRPFSAAHLLNVLPRTLRQITVLDRTKEPGASGEPLYLDVVAALQGSPFQNIPVLSGRYGLSSKNTTPDHINAVFCNQGKKRFTIGIRDDVTHLSLPVAEHISIQKESTISCKFWGLGGDGTVSANKNSIKIIGNHTDRYVQGYFEYDSKKSRGLTISHLRFDSQPIRSPYLVEHADFVACHNPVYLHKYPMAEEVKDGGIFLLNCYWKEKELEQYLPQSTKQYLAEHQIRLFVIDAIQIGKEIGLNNKISTILQAAFFRLSGIIPPQEASRLMKEAARISYGKKGENIVQMNYAAIDRGLSDVVEIKIPSHWKSAGVSPSASDSPDAVDSLTFADSLDSGLLTDRPETLEYVCKLQKPIADQQGNALPVSAFLPYADGSFPVGTAAHERRNVATEVPVWKPENCIQCNRCSFVCPHAVIRPCVMTPAEKENAPDKMPSLPMTGMPEHHFAITVSFTDCTGCGSCAGICPGRQGEKALEMCPVNEHEENQIWFDYGKALSVKPNVLEKFKEHTVKGSQFRRPLMEFSGACAGCGETPYVKLITQLFGEEMYIANATGCTSIWGNSSPATPYALTEQGKGPAWSHSLFEDGAEFGYGMLLAQTALRARLKSQIEQLILQTDNTTLRDAAENWLATYSSRTENRVSSDSLIKALTALMPRYDLPSNSGRQYPVPTEIAGCSLPLLRDILENKDFLSPKSQWVLGGDGWAYDIGFGGLDHVLASGQNINVLVLDTEVYSNTGGQASKATPVGSTAKFASGGKETRKKDLASIAMTYGYVYVAQISMGADFNQTLKALTEAEQYDGPSLIIAYSPCIAHGIRAGMGSSQHEQKKAVDSGYFHLFRFHPALAKEGKNPFLLDSKEPILPYEEFLSGEIRYDVLKRTNPEKARELFTRSALLAKERYQHLKRLSAFYEPYYESNKMSETDKSDTEKER